MTVLIDGYNFAHAAGFVRASMRPAEFRAARESMLGYLSDRCPDGADVLVVFDGKNAPRHTGELRAGRLRVRYSQAEVADDTIESLLSRHTRAMAWTLVSNDTRLHESARRRACRVWSHADLLDWLAEPTPAPKPVPRAKGEKPAGPGADEVADLLRVFGGGR